MGVILTTDVAARTLDRSRPTMRIAIATLLFVLVAMAMCQRPQRRPLGPRRPASLLPLRSRLRGPSRLPLRGPVRLLPVRPRPQAVYRRRKARARVLRPRGRSVLASLAGRLAQNNRYRVVRRPFPRPLSRLDEVKKSLDDDKTIPNFYYKKAEDIPGYQKFTLSDVVVPEDEDENEERAERRLDDVAEDELELVDSDKDQDDVQKEESESETSEQKREEKEVAVKGEER